MTFAFHSVFTDTVLVPSNEQWLIMYSIISALIMFCTFFPILAYLITKNFSSVIKYDLLCSETLSKTELSFVILRYSQSLFYYVQ